MKKITSYVWVAVVIMTAVSCANQGFKKTKSGLQYSIISDGKGEPVKKGQFLKITFVQKVHDSLLNSSANGLPQYVRVDSVGPMYNPAEVFGFLRKGDSATIVMLADTLLHKYGQLPPFIKKKDKIVLAIRVVDVFASEDLVKADQKKYLDAEKDKETKAIDDYLAKNNITNAQKTKSGAYYVITDIGSGPKADSGKIVSIKYTGYSFEGKPFDSNTDSTKQSPPGHPLTPYEFKSGQSGAIHGMLEAIQYFNKGGKGKMFIPAMLGYGPQGMGGTIKPFENLVFDIEVVDVKDAPVKPAQVMNPGVIPPKAIQPHK
jgi:FKBP-type peptidyl-prolyl cis-trans isomerase FkpA